MIPIDLDIKIEKILNFEVLKNGYLNYSVKRGLDYYFRCDLKR